MKLSLGHIHLYRPHQVRPNRPSTIRQMRQTVDGIAATIDDDAVARPAPTPRHESLLHQQRLCYATSDHLTL